MKVRGSLKALRKRHPLCKLVKRKGIQRIINKIKKRYQARQG